MVLTMINYAAVHQITHSTLLFLYNCHNDDIVNYRFPIFLHP